MGVHYDTIMEDVTPMCLSTPGKRHISSVEESNSNLCKKPTHGNFWQFRNVGSICSSQASSAAPSAPSTAPPSPLLVPAEGYSYYDI